jgi:hypothetical protein
MWELLIDFCFDATEVRRLSFDYEMITASLPPLRCVLCLSFVAEDQHMAGSAPFPPTPIYQWCRL